MKTMRAKTNKKILTLEIVILMVIVAVVAITIIHERRNKQEENEYDNLRSMTVQISQDTNSSSNQTSLNENSSNEAYFNGENTENLNKSSISHDFDQLKKVNPDIYAWISIEDTSIDYPIVQRKGDDSYYLDHNVDGTKGYPGCIFTEDINHKDFKDFVTVIYGHNMRNGTMFSALHKFEDKEYYDSHKIIYISTPTDELTYQIIAIGIHNDNNLLYSEDVTSIDNLLNLIRSFEDAEPGIVSNDSLDHLNDQDKFIILSTCNGWNQSTRYLVIAVQV